MSNDEKLERWKREIEEKIERERQAVAAAIGIDRDFRPVTLAYNQRSGIIIASVDRISAESFDSRLFFRHSSEHRYRQVGSPPPGIHYRDVITSPTLPVIYYLVQRFTKKEGASEFTGDWLSVDRFDLNLETAESVITKDGLQLSEPYTGGWVSQLFGVLTDESAIICSCALTGNQENMPHYWLCTVQPRSQKVTLLSRLDAVWF